MNPTFYRVLSLKRSFSLFLSLRYLRPKRTFVSAITVISTIGVVIGVSSLTVVIAIMTGFNIEMREAILGFEPHLVLSKDANEPIEDWYELLDEVAEVPGVLDVAPNARGQVVLDFNRRVWVVQIYGIDPEPGGFSDQYATLIGNGVGEFDLSDDNIVIGSTLARGMSINVGDTVSLLSLVNGREMLDAFNTDRKPENLIQPAELTVVGIYDSGRHDYDDTIVFIPLEIGQYLYDLGGSVDSIHVLAEEPFQVDVLKERLVALVGDRANVDTWVERNKKLFDAVALERLMMFFLLFMVIVVAAFCIMNTMITVTTQKRREIGIMKAVGARTGQIVGAFLGQGILVGLLGTSLGIGFAFFVLLIRKNLVHGIAAITGMDIYSPALYSLYQLPAMITILDLMRIAGGAFLACALASLLPAYVASRLDAALSLRNQSTI